MTEEEKQRGLELQSYIDSIRDMTIKEIAIKYLKKHHLPKFLEGLLVKFSYPLLLAKDCKLSELEEELKKWKDEWQEQVQKANDEAYARTLQTMQLTKAKELIENIIRVTWGEGWNYSLDWKVKAEAFLNSEVVK